MSNVKTQSFFLEIQDDETIVLQSALTARMHKLHEVIMDPQTSLEVRQIHRVNYTRLNELRRRLLAAFTEPSSRS